MFNSYVTNHSFENRLYLSPLSESEIKSSIYSENGGEYKGASIRSYSESIGFLLSLLGISSKIKIGDKSYYINNKSFSQFIIRTTELDNVNSPKEAAKKLNDLYIKHKQIGYNQNKIDLINSKIKQIFRKKEMGDFAHILKHLKMVAIHEGKRDQG